MKPWSDASLSRVWSDSALFGYVLKYDAIGYVRSYRDGDRIFQNSLVDFELKKVLLPPPP